MDMRVQAVRLVSRKIRHPSRLRRDAEPAWAKFLKPCLQEKRLGMNGRARTKTDTGRQVENTKAIGRTLVKELGKMTP